MIAEVLDKFQNVCNAANTNNTKQNRFNEGRISKLASIVISVF